MKELKFLRRIKSIAFATAENEYRMYELQM